MATTRHFSPECDRRALRRSHALVLLVIVGLLWLALPAHAQDAGTAATNANYTGIIDMFNSAASKWQGPLQSAAAALYWSLVTISLVLTFMPLALRGAEFNEWADTAFRFVFVTGFWLWMIHNYSSLANSLITGFRHAAQNAVGASGGSSTMSPTDILKCGIDLANVALNQASIWSPVLTLAVCITACIIYIIFALVAGLVALTLVESYVVINASVIFMAFAGFRFTSDIAMHAIKYAIGVGVKLFSLQLIVGVSISVFQTWTAQYSSPGLLATVSDIFGLACLIILVFYLAVHLPPALMGMITGAHGGGMQMGGMFAGAAAVASGAAAGAAAAGGAGAALGGAKALASEQLKARETAGNAPQSPFARMAAMAGGTISNLAGAAMQDVGARLGGRPGSNMGTMGGRMADSMNAQAEGLRSERSKPTPPGGGGGGTTSGSPPPSAPPPSSPPPDGSSSSPPPAASPGSNIGAPTPPPPPGASSPMSQPFTSAADRDRLAGMADLNGGQTSATLKRGDGASHTEQVRSPKPGDNPSGPPAPPTPGGTIRGGS